MKLRRRIAITVIGAFIGATMQLGFHIESPPAYWLLGFIVGVLNMAATMDN